MIPDIPLYTLSKRHGRGRAPHAGTVKPDPNETVGGDIDQFDIAAVRLNRRANRVQNPGDAAKNIREGFPIDTARWGIRSHVREL